AAVVQATRPPRHERRLRPGLVGERARHGPRVLGREKGARRVHGGAADRAERARGRLMRRPRHHGVRRPVASSRRTRSNTPCHIARVSLPVLVFCRLGWYDATRATPLGSVVTAPCAKIGRSRGSSVAHHPAALSQLSCAIRPRVSTTRTWESSRTSATRYGRQRSSSTGLGLLPGGAQRAAAVM